VAASCGSKASSAATKTAPTSGRVFRIGKVIGAASGGLYPVRLGFQYIIDLP
jgi:hypothetical protein